MIKNKKGKKKEKTAQSNMKIELGSLTNSKMRQALEL